MEIWGGIECTINRVGDHYYNQLDSQGHYQRKEDLSLLVNLGIQKLRYPVLWEKHRPQQNKPIDWGVVENNLLYLKDAGVTVIAGLVHHGSGPCYVNFLDDSFADGLAEYAKAVAEKFPWIDYYTPINEPLTTARFCGLYGLWYPHEKNDRTFLRILYNECKATILAMAAIRRINPRAKLIHTEDLGKTHSTPLLKYQADFENERRWLGLDLLCGKVNTQHPLWPYLLRHGLTAHDLAFFQENAMPPDILGFNYYITSERYLDENLKHFPAHTHGGNSNLRYADVEAVRYCEAIAGPKVLLKQAWERFKIPLAVTEAHLGCGREDQLRWLMEIYQAAVELKKEGIDIKGITAWSLFGAYGWDKLLTEEGGNYESGVFDLRSGFPRATALARLVRNLALGKPFEHPVVRGDGWWKRPGRIIYPEPFMLNLPMPDLCSPLLIIGATGTLGQAFARVCMERNLHFIALNRKELNVVVPAQIEAMIQRYQPWAIINAAGFVRVDEAEIEQEDCFLSNTEGPANLADACRKYGIKFLTFSSDLVFDGEKGAPYIENDRVNPLNVYGASKAKAEQEVLKNDPDALIIRTSAFFSPWDNYNFVSHILSSLNQRTSVKVASDVYISPTYVPDLVNVSLDLLIDDERGLWHLTNQGTLTWSDFAYDVARRGNYNPSFLLPLPVEELGYPAVRPNFSALTSMHGLILPSLDFALDRFFADKTVKSLAC
ncbi:family 1 glycosylhydrolase [Pedobacter sp.]|uniref:family 1 glycosylhydrolase n=1 Tax=Pedobacter sp. TaxID=1411316 RepID=UPI003D7FA272